MFHPFSPEAARHTICIVDDSPVVHAGLRLILADSVNLVFFANIKNNVEVLNAIRELTPSLVLLDITNGDGVSLKLGQELHGHWPGLPWIVFSDKEEIVYAERVIRSGGRGYVMKKEGLDVIWEAVRTVLSGEVWLSRRVLPHLLRSFKPESGPGKHFFDQLSDQELVIFHLIGKGMGARLIANRLCLSPRTVESHREQMKTKLGLSSHNALSQFAIANRAISLH